MEYIKKCVRRPLRKAHRFIRRFLPGARYVKGPFIFLHGTRLSKKERLRLEKDSNWRGKTEHLELYQRRADSKKIVVVNLDDSELSQLLDLGEEMFIGFGPINFSDFLQGALECICPTEDKHYRWNESTLKFYLNNYTQQKDTARVTRQFLAMYQYAIERIRGETVLDAGTCSGIFPILLKIRNPGLDVTGGDAHNEYFRMFALPYCENNNLNINFIRLDVFSPPPGKKYDTVTSIHVLEHFEEKDTLLFLENHLSMTNKRLIVIVPFEEYAAQHDHKQFLNAKKLEEAAASFKLPYRVEHISGWSHALTIDVAT